MSDVVNALSCFGNTTPPIHSPIHGIDQIDDDNCANTNTT